MTHPVRFLYQHGYQKDKKRKKADVQISNLKLHLLRKDCYFLYFEKTTLVLPPKLT